MPPTALVALTAMGIAACEDVTRPVAGEWNPSTPQLSVAVGGPADLGRFVPSAINNLGQVAGIRGTPSGSVLPVVWTPSSPGAATGALVDLPLLVNGGGPVTGGISDVGQIAGRVAVSNPVGESHVVIWTIGPTGATVTDLGTFGNSSPGSRDVNDAGQVIGTYLDGGRLRAFLWAPSEPGSATGITVDLGNLGGPVTEAFDINNLGQVVGRARTASGEDHAFLWTPSASGASTGTMLNLGALAGGVESYALSVNDFGHVVGWRSTAPGEAHAVLWSVSASGSVTVQDLDVGGLGSQARAINNLGQVVGVVFNRLATGSLEERGFFWAPTEGATVLNSLGGGCEPDDGRDVVCSRAVGINDRGEAVGSSWTGSALHATRWTVRVAPPTPVEQVEAVNAEVLDLVAAGAVSQGQGNALTAKLDAATKQLNGGNTQAAINLLEAFIRQCQAYVAAGILTAAEAQPLIDAAQALIDELES
jgi:probable HAF family extracellular repeat protein